LVAGDEGSCRGRDDLFAPGSPAKRIGWDVVRAAELEILVIALCSSPMVRSMKRLNGSEGRRDGLTSWL
jgi:hypothetical protein